VRQLNSIFLSLLEINLARKEGWGMKSRGGKEL